MIKTLTQFRIQVQELFKYATSTRNKVTISEKP